jgi:hypothetical protein
MFSQLFQSFPTSLWRRVGAIGNLCDGSSRAMQQALVGNVTKTGVVPWGSAGDDGVVLLVRCSGGQSAERETMDE